MYNNNLKYFFKTLLYWPIKKPITYLFSWVVNSGYIGRKKYRAYNLSRITGPNRTFCHAPQNSIYFSNVGRVSACCFNKEFHYGNYNVGNLKEILNHKNSNIIAESLKKYDLSKGCANCQNLLDSENYKAIGSHQYDTIKINKQYPTMMEFELSNMCNFACIMCSPIYSSKLELLEDNSVKPKPVYDKNFVDELNVYIPHLQKAKFFGGEPFLIEIYYDIWERIIKLNPKCEIIVQTNASILNDKVKSLFKRGNFRLSISIDTLDKDNYEYIRKGSDFNLIMKNVEYFIEYSKTKKNPLFFSICPMQQNWMDIPRLIDYCNTNKIYLNFNTVNSPHECAIVNMSSGKISEIKKYYKNYKFSSSGFIKKQNGKHFKGLQNQINEWYFDACKIEKGKKFYTIETIKEILLNKVDGLKDNEAIERFEKLLDTYPSQIEMSEYHYNRLLNLKGFKVEKVIKEKRENVQKIKLNNLFMLQ